jgi:threonine/homoserine/homoserine lactone efflux protein
MSLSGVKVAGWGAFISLLGSLPLGTLNVAAMQVSLAEGLVQAMYFCAGVALVEMLYVRISISGVAWVLKYAKWLRLMEWVAIAIVLALALGSFYAYFKGGGQKSFVLQSGLPNFLLGITLSAINPMQLPFWFGWSTVLFTKGVLKPVSSCYNWYISGIGLGTLCGLGLFAYGGWLLVGPLQQNSRYINLGIGIVFAVTAVILFIKLWTKKPIEEKVAEVGMQSTIGSHKAYAGSQQSAD